jgi:polysaccharide biosynthesis/export protein
VVCQQFIHKPGVVSSEPGKNGEEKFSSAFFAVKFSSLSFFARVIGVCEQDQRVRSEIMAACVKTSLLAVLLGIILAGCSSVPATPPVAPKQGAGTSSSSSVAAEINRNIAAAAILSSGASSDYRLGPEDLVEITIFNIPEAMNVERGVTPRTNTVRVTEQGQISLPLIGEIDVRGLTVLGLEKKLREAYDAYIYNPQVGVLVREYRQRVSVIGSVQKPGVFELSGPKTVIGMLAMAGGVTDQAGTQVQIYRQGPNSRENYIIDLAVLASNAELINAKTEPLITMPVQSGDIINIPLAGTFFVDGAVKRPGFYPLGRRYSLMQALTAAGGVDRDLYSADITIFRKRTSGVEPIGIDLNEVVAGSTVDPEIVADDVILVPISTAKYAYFKVFGQILGWGTSIAGAASWAGS